MTEKDAERSRQKDPRQRERKRGREREELLRVLLAAAQEMQETGSGGIPAWLTPKNAGISLSGSVCVCV